MLFKMNCHALRNRLTQKTYSRQPRLANGRHTGTPWPRLVSFASDNGAVSSATEKGVQWNRESQSFGHHGSSDPCPAAALAAIGPKGLPYKGDIVCSSS